MSVPTMTTGQINTFRD